VAACDGKHWDGGPFRPGTVYRGGGRGCYDDRNGYEAGEGGKGQEGTRHLDGR
jgi:hypothetical protein